MKTPYSLVFSLFFLHPAFSQKKKAAIWYFGNYAA
jgi:hypothetical protein